MRSLEIKKGSYNGQRKEGELDMTMFITIGRGRQGAVGIVMIPQRRRVKGILDIVHELDHLLYIMTRLDDKQRMSIWFMSRQDGTWSQVESRQSEL